MTTATAQQAIENSREYLGSGTYKTLAPFITERGLEAGWRWTYPAMLSLNGVNFSKFTTLDALIADGLVELQWTTKTCF